MLGVWECRGGGGCIIRCQAMRRPHNSPLPQIIRHHEMIVAYVIPSQHLKIF